eukprot:Gb_31269 [translate_table: standard]
MENGLSHRSESRQISRDASSDRSESRQRSRDGSSHRSESRQRRDIEADSSVSKHKSRDVEVAPRVQPEKSSRKIPSSPPPPPVYTEVPSSDPLPPPPPPVYPDVPTSGPLPPPPPPPPPPPFPIDGKHVSYSHDDLKQEKMTSSHADAVGESVDSDSEFEPESEPEIIVPNHSNEQIGSSTDEVDQRADAFIAKFREQIRLQRIESIRRHHERRD